VVVSEDVPDLEALAVEAGFESVSVMLNETVVAGLAVFQMWRQELAAADDKATMNQWTCPSEGRQVDWSNGLAYL